MLARTTEMVHTWRTVKGVTGVSTGIVLKSREWLGPFVLYTCSLEPKIFTGDIRVVRLACAVTLGGRVFPLVMCMALSQMLGGRAWAV